MSLLQGCVSGRDSRLREQFEKGIVAKVEREDRRDDFTHDDAFMLVMELGYPYPWYVSYAAFIEVLRDRGFVPSYVSGFH